MKKILFCVLCVSLLLSSCAGVGYVNAADYGEALRNSDYAVYIITDDYTSAPTALTTPAFMLELEMLKSGGSLTPESMLLASDGDMMNIIVVFYFESEAVAVKAEESLKAYSARADCTLKFTCEQSENAVKIHIEQE